jgi:3-oxoacyl-(acyl-carrier-protein) synthase
VTGIENTSPLAISAWSAISPFGYGREAFAEGLRTGLSTVSFPDHERWAVEDDEACLVPGFDTRELLGAKGTRSMNRVTGLAVATAGQLLAEIGYDSGGEGTEDLGLVLGTTTGSAESMMSLTRASLVGDRPDHIEPALVPSCVMNCAAGQVAIWHQVKGPNATIAAGRNTGLLALNYARRLLVTGRARRVLCGAAEEYTTARSRLERAARGGAAGELPPGEGCAMLLLEPEVEVIARGDSPLATLLGFESRTALDGDIGAATRFAVRRLLDRAGVSVSEVHAAAGSTGSAAENSALLDVFGAEVTGRPSLSGLIGDTASAASIFELAGLLAISGSGTDLTDALAVVTACEDDGSVSAVLVRLHGVPAGATRELVAAGGVR